MDVTILCLRLKTKLATLGYQDNSTFVQVPLCTLESASPTNMEQNSLSGGIGKKKST